jgi:serine/threonine-protein kinase RsbW
MQKNHFIAHDSQTITETRVHGDHVLVKLRDSINPNDIVDRLHAFFDNLFKEGMNRIVLDMGNVPFPSGSFIALLIAKTMEARKFGGDIQIVHLLDTAKNNFSFFTPLTFLSIVSNAEKLSVPIPEESPKPAPAPAENLFAEDQKPNRIRVNATIDALQDVTDFVSVWLKDPRIEPKDRSKMKIAVHEACMNVIEHGYKFVEGKEIQVEVLFEDNCFKVIISDWGIPFEKFGKSDYNVQEAFEKQQRGGYGFYIMQQSVDEIRYEFGDGGNKLTLILELE